VDKLPVLAYLAGQREQERGAGKLLPSIGYVMEEASLIPGAGLVLAAMLAFLEMASRADKALGSRHLLRSDDRDGRRHVGPYLLICFPVACEQPSL